MFLNNLKDLSSFWFSNYKDYTIQAIGESKFGSHLGNSNSIEGLENLSKCLIIAFWSTDFLLEIKNIFQILTPGVPFQIHTMFVSLDC
jgi:hypothetical protein